MSQLRGFRDVLLRLALVLVGYLAVGLVAVPVVLSDVKVAQAQGVRISAIQVAGNRRVEPETVRTYLKFTTGDRYDAWKVDASLKALFSTGLFSDVRIDLQGSVVVVTIVENPVINQVAFEGNSEVDDDTLSKEVQLKSRSVYTRARVQADVQRILDVYRRSGRFAATVEPQLIQLDNNRVNLVFVVNEGGATKVKAINFVGNRAFSDSQLRDIVTTTQSGWFDFLKGTSIYDPDRLNLDRELLRQYYLKNGYADVQVTTAGAELDRDGSGFFITYVIDEGPVYSFGVVDIRSSLASLNAEALKGELLTLAGQTFNAAQMDKTVERLTLAVSQQGYAFARVRPRASRDVASRTIAVSYVVDEGPRVFIERINVIGNTRTKDKVIRREFRLAEGDAYNPLMVEQAKKRLQALGFFKTVEVKRRPGSGNDRVVIDVEVVEQSTGELSFGAGYSTNEGVIGDISLSERNLLGNGQFVRLRLAGSFERMQIDLSFTEPRFLDQNLSAGFDLYHKETTPSSDEVFKTRNTGGGVRLGVPLNENLWLSTGYSFSRNEIFDVDKSYDPNIGDYRIASLAIRQAEGVSYTSAANLGLSFDQRNHPKNPTSGYFLSAGTEFAGLGGDVQYARFTAEGRAYYPITEKITFVGRIIGGHIMGWGGDDVRLVDLFYKGGETVRGFARGGFGPRDLVTGDAIGGETFWSATAEVRFPLPLVPTELGMSGAVFADAGSLFGAGGFAKALNGTNRNCSPDPTIPGQIANSICLVDSSAIRSSVGVGLLWNSPLGPLRLDWAYVLTKEKYDDEQSFRFGASTKF